MSSIVHETISGVKWSMVRKFTVQPVMFLYGMVLARLITPEEMGILGLTAIFFALAAQLQNCGFGSALIRKQDRTEADCSTMFWFNVGASFVLSLCLFCSAGWFAEFFHQPALVNLTRVSAALMFISSMQSVHFTLYSARRDFKAPAIIGIISTLVPMPFTLWAAWSGWSYWSLLVQSTLSALLNLVLVWSVSPWKPRFIFSRKSFCELFAFGSKLTMTGMVTQAYNQSRTFVIGKFYSAAHLALFSRAYHLCTLPIQLIYDTLMGVSYPVLATLQNEPERLNSVYRKYVRIVCMPVEWIMMTLAANSHAIVTVLYGERWSGCADFCRVICFGCMLTPLSGLNVSFLQVRGQVGLLLKREVIVRIAGLTFLALGAWHSVMGVCVATMCSGFFSMLVAVTFTARVTSITFRQQMADFLPYLLLSIVVNIPGYILDEFRLLPIWFCAVIGPLLAFVLQFAYLWLRKDETFLFLLNMAAGNPKVKGLMARIKRA